MRAAIASLFLLPFITALPSQAADACITIDGRAHLYGGDGQVRVWHVGTHHEYQPDDSSRATVQGWLEAGVKDPENIHTAASPASTISMFADFLICPTEPFKKGSVQTAKIVSAQNRHYLPAK
jgi:hypothetical protein